MIRLLVMIGLFVPCSGIAQEVEITPVAFNGQQMPTQIIGMAQDEQGYIWMCDVQHGMFRFDGINLVRYGFQVGNPNSITANRTECIIENDGLIWLGTFANGLNQFDPDRNTVKQYLHDPNDSTTIRSNHIRTLAFDSDGMLWIGTLTGVDKLDPHTGVFTHVHTKDPDEDILHLEHIRAMMFDSKGILWIGSSSPFPNEATVGGLFRFDTKQLDITHYKADGEENSLTNSKVRALFEDSRGTFWVGTAGDGLHTLNRKTGVFTHHPYRVDSPHTLSRPPVNPGYPELDHITFINEDNEGFIWIGTFGAGLNRFDPQNSTVRHFHPKNPVPYRVQSIAFWSSLKTRDDLLWISNWVPNNLNEFVFRINARPTKIQKLHIEGTSRINCFAEDHLGNTYFGSINGLWQEDGTGKIENLLALEGYQNVAMPGIRQIEFEDEVDLWLPTIQGLFKFNSDTKDLIRFQHGNDPKTSLSHNSINRVEYLGDHQLLVATDAGLDLFNTRTYQVEQINFSGQNSTLSNQIINLLLKDSYNQIWMAAGYKGVKRLDWETGQVTDYRVGSAWINALYEDSQGRVWVGTESFGLFCYDRDQDSFIQIEDNRGLLTSGTSVFAMTEDQDHNMWISIIGGFIRLNTETLESLQYGITWGITSFSTNSFFTSSKGEILVGTDEGYFRFHPQKLRIPEFKTARPFVSQIYVDNQATQLFSLVLSNPDDNINPFELEHDQNNISFDINHIDYLINPGDKKLQYRLFGYEPKWHESQSGKEISYYNLDPGAYELGLRASDINGNWGETLLPFEILKPWWKRWWAYLGYLGVLIFGVWQVHRFQRDRTIRIEQERAKDRELEQAKEVEKAYNQLKATQSQLIQAEKMASLGELTAGIAHEIQNPLNFVNNFSEVNAELLDELVEEIDKKDWDEVKSIAHDLKENETKISHHGKRADSIVKNMLMHSRQSTNEKEDVDINVLADEYLRLAYHGMRAKDKSFNAQLETNFDKSLQKITVVPQDIGRVILNLITNAFHATDQNRNGQSDGYLPNISISTKQLDRQVEIQILDNGTGIPVEIKEKIFQPFFTTKPTGEGTGLGLSLSYDIIKAHGGTLEVDSTPNEGSTFTITLPLKPTT